MGSAETSNEATPCTNRPVACKHCKLVVASYSMAQHYADKHSGTEMPADLKTAISLGKHERDHTMQLLKKRTVTSVCTGQQCCPKRAKTCPLPNA